MTTPPYVDPAGPAPRWLGPPVSEWPDDVYAWCQRCDRPITDGVPYMLTIPFVGSWGGFAHAWCPPRLTVVR